MIHGYHFILSSGLPAQERIGLPINDIPGVGGVGLARSDCDYVPCRP